jgi:ribosome-binding protein aMBF1 (putative translation factor)
MDGQDWSPVVVNKGKTRSSAASDQKHVSPGLAAQHRIENDEPRKTKSLSPESRKAILQARVANKWNQTQLNTQCSFPQNTIRDIENGKLCPTPQQLNVLSRVLKVILKYAP